MLKKLCEAVLVAIKMRPDILRARPQIYFTSLIIALEIFFPFNNLWRRLDEMNFFYRGFFHCGECSFTITADREIKKSGKQYAYYYCTKKNPVGLPGKATMPLKKWFITLPFEIKGEMDHFDDCPICQTGGVL